MKTSLKSISLIFAAGAAGVAVFALANAQFTAGLPAVKLLSLAISVALLSLAMYDYSRRVQPLRVPARLLRPTLPAAQAIRCVTPNCNDRIAA